jgi:hypothetical protein
VSESTARRYGLKIELDKALGSLVIAVGFSWRMVGGRRREASALTSTTASIMAARRGAEKQC